MKIALCSNWGAPACGVANFGRDFQRALEAAGHEVARVGWGDRPLGATLLINWDSGTLPADQPVPEGSTVFVHHTYRGIPEGLAQARLILSPLPKAGETGSAPWEDFPYPTPAYRSAVAPVLDPVTIGVTTVRKEGVDWLEIAARRFGWTIAVPDRWRDTEEEIDRLAACTALALWYRDSPGRSLALQTALAAQRPLLLTACPTMFHDAWGSEEIVWAPETFEIPTIEAMLAALVTGATGPSPAIPRRLAQRWTWPMAVGYLEALWQR